MDGRHEVLVQSQHLLPIRSPSSSTQVDGAPCWRVHSRACVHRGGRQAADQFFRTWIQMMLSAALAQDFCCRASCWVDDSHCYEVWTWASGVIAEGARHGTFSIVWGIARLNVFVPVISLLAVARTKRKLVIIRL